MAVAPDKLALSERRGVCSPRQGWLLAAIAVAARVAVVSNWPARAFSCDLKDWRLIAAALLIGLNPYQQHYGVELNWPPMWMECLYAVAKVSDRFNWSFFTCVRGLLIAGDAILILSTWALVRLLKCNAHAFPAVLFGLALNPFMIILTVQQGNFDVIPTVATVWFVYFLIRWTRSGDITDWLFSAALLGLGAFAKTYPLALFPLLAINGRQIPGRARVLGAALCVGPAALSLAPLYTLYPRDIIDHVVMYRGTIGPMGISGFLYWLLGPQIVEPYSRCFTAVLLVTLCLLAFALYRRRMPGETDLVLLVALIFTGIFEFGSGFCPQYWMWAAPFLAIAYVHQTRVFRRVLLAVTIVVIVTNVLSFAYNDNAGAFIIHWSSVPGKRALLDLFNSNLPLSCLPMTVSTLVLFVYGCRELLAAQGDHDRGPDRVFFPS